MIAFIRGIRLSIHLLVGLLLVALVNLRVSRRLDGPQAMHWWCNVLLDVLNIELSVSGEPARGARFSVANHVSWLDMILIGACEPTRFVSKSEVQHWPVAGWLANAAGTFYIRRGKGGAAPLIERMIPHLSNGGAVVIFPEGTTTDGSLVKPFFPRLFAAAIDAQCPVQSIAIRYEPDANGAQIAPFIGDDDLFSHILRVLRTPQLRAELSYGRAFRPGEQTREQVAERACNEIRAALGQTHAGLVSETAAAAA